MRVPSYVTVGFSVVFAAVTGTQSFGQGQSPNTQPSSAIDNIAAERSAREQAARDAGLRRQSEDAYQRMQESMLRARTMSSRRMVNGKLVFVRERDLPGKEKKLLAPSPEDLQTYAEFLRRPGTGIFRLMQVDSEAYGKVVSAKDEAAASPLALLGGGAHYSYTKLNHDPDQWSDICWQGDVLRTEIGGESLGLLVNLGDVPLDSLGLQSRGIEYLAGLTPPQTEREAEAQFQRNEAGFTQGGFTYRAALPWKLNATYALRSTNFARADVLVAFRPMRQDANGSLIVLWKKLKTYSAPSFKKARK